MSSGQQEIVVQGAREHNLRAVDVRLPRDALTTITGVSGSGKSSLAFDTIFQEGQRRFVESLSAYARQFLGQGEKPRVDHIEGLSPAVAIDQKTVSRNPRSTVGTITEIHDHLRLLFARLGEPHCPACDRPVRAQAPEQIVDRIEAECAGRQVMVLGPIVRDRKGSYRKELEEFRSKGFVRARIDGVVLRLDEPVELGRYERHTIEVVVDRIRVAPEKRGRLAEAVEQALALADGRVAILDGERHELYSGLLACAGCGIDLPEMEPRSFSFNSPQGACSACDGLGLSQQPDPRRVVPDPGLSIDEGAVLASHKGGWRLRRRARPEILAQVCDALDIPRDRPFRSLNAAQRRLILEGAGEQMIEIEVHQEGPRLRYHRRERRRWEGVMPAIRDLHRRSPGRDLARFLAPSPCAECGGMRLKAAALSVRFRGRSIGELAALPVGELRSFFAGVRLEGNEATIGERVLRELDLRLGFLDRVGLGYLGIDRSAATLSGGESQRIRLATQVGAGLQGILYVLDEPSIGLHARDAQLLIATLRDLRDRGNTVLVVEHDEETILASDHVVDVGPGAGAAGGRIVAEGTPAEIADDPESVTGAFLARRETIPVPAQRRGPGERELVVRGARAHNLRSLDVTFPLGRFIAVTGVSGSGKSTLIDLVLKRELARRFHAAEAPPGEHDAIEGLEHLDKVIEIDQSPIGRTPRSNPATYTKVFGPIRDLFAALPEARMRGYTKGRFSFNVKGGRCEECGGAGARLIEMQFLADVTVPCEACGGHRFNPETLEIRYRGKSVNDVLEMTIDVAAAFFTNHPAIARVLEMLRKVGLGYMKLGQPSTTLSGGEAQRVKLASQLQRPGTGRTLYLLDEPTTGLHFVDVRRLVEALQALVDQGNTVIVVEHDLDVVKCADWIVDLGPEGGAGGGELLYAGVLEGIVKVSGSHTGRELSRQLRRRAPRRGRSRRRREAPQHDEIRVTGARQHNLRGVDARFPRGRMTVVTGPSGSGKTSLAFDTLFAEGQRRFVECLSTYARQFLGRLEHPAVESIEGLAPAIAIDQRTAGRNPRSTVATATELHDYLRLLYSRVGQPHCPRCGQDIAGFSPDRAADHLLAEFAEAKGRLLAPLHVSAIGHVTALRRPAELKRIQQELRDEGFLRVLVDGEELRLDQPLPALARKKEVWLVVDRLQLRPTVRVRLLDSISQAYGRGLGVLAFEDLAGRRVLLSEVPACVACGFYFAEEMSPRMFSFNSHVGACEDCHGLGIRLVCDPARLIANPDVPLFEGALIDKPGDFFTRGDRYFGNALRRLAEQLRFDLARPWKKLGAGAREAILYGSDVEVKVGRSRDDDDGAFAWEMTTTWKGLCRYVEEWYRNATNESWLDVLGRVMREDRCDSCGGDRLKPEYLAVTVGTTGIGEVGRMSVEQAAGWVSELRFEGSDAVIAEQILAELTARLGFLEEVGLGYVGLARSTASLSGGEAQRIRLATQIGNRLTGVIYVLDEPTIGLHQRDTARLLDTLRGLRDLGNTVVLVEHDPDTIDAADWIIDLGPGAGHRGGEVVFQGSRKDLEGAATLTADYLCGRRRIEVGPRRPCGERMIELRGVHQNNLKGVDVSLPRGVLCCVTGVSGSGKSSLVMETLAPAARQRLARPGTLSGVDELEGLAGVAQCVIVDQSPIGTSPKSNPATYVGIFDRIRTIMSQAPLARLRGFGPGRFSFNTVAGRCAACAGRGSVKVEMHFLPDVWITCDVCRGRRYDRETLAVEYRGRSVADILDMEVSEAVTFFANHGPVAEPLALLDAVGLGYLKLGQPATTLSGGEAQRIKLARELARRSRGEVLYLLDEPTTGLHLDDVEKLVHVLHRLVDQGHSVVVIEHNLEVIKTADWVVDLGPEGGDGGGRVVAAGTPEAIAAHPESFTGAVLAPVLARPGAGGEGQAERRLAESAH